LSKKKVKYIGAKVSEVIEAADSSTKDAMI